MKFAKKKAREEIPPELREQHRKNVRQLQLQSLQALLEDGTLTATQAMVSAATNLKEGSELERIWNEHDRSLRPVVSACLQKLLEAEG